MKSTSLITVSINDVMPFPIPWNIEPAVIPSGTIIKKRHITWRNAAIEGAINALWDEYAKIDAIFEANMYIIVLVINAIPIASFAE